MAFENTALPVAGSPFDDSVVGLDPPREGLHNG